MSALGIVDTPVYTVDKVARPFFDVIQREIAANVPINFVISA